ncbi:MAG: hypothetical protein A2792_03435 [Sphingomonadales bacterium RIFCSPHIGHO2_01_FULL_65_20]|nr:MAG: hypothetical protein A2792_03435 [Sphingomonadales bacterium RIFCSPHIGHO2_01_FULL_65_20]
MAEFPHFAGEPIWLVTVVGTGADAAIPVTVNGITMKVQRATPTRMPEPFKIALEDGGYSISALPEIKDEMAIDPLGEEGLSAGAGEDGETGSQLSGTTSFDAEAVINGTIPEVTARLEGLTPEQLAAVLAAETDREQSRKGVLEAIAKLTAEPPAE